MSVPPPQQPPPRRSGRRGRKASAAARGSTTRPSGPTSLADSRFWNRNLRQQRKGRVTMPVPNINPN